VAAALKVSSTRRRRRSRSRRMGRSMCGRSRTIRTGKAGMG
jgi:hypothetical protein